MGRPKGIKNKKSLSFRAGKRKCHRCKLVWYRKKGISSRVCYDCKSRCFRCALFLDGKSQYCNKCNSEIKKISTRTNDPTGAKYKDYSLNKRYGITLIE